MCLNPVAITKECCGRPYTCFVPCGKCAECVKDKQNEYIIRTLEETAKVKGDVYFVTLTYSDKNVPLTVDEDGELFDEETGEILSTLKTLNNHDITAWKKRCRRYIQYHFNRKCEFSYLICGEYGPRTHRPHYHGIFIGISPEDMEIFKDDWESNYGYTCIKKISRFDIERTARYISKYITKMKDLEDENVMNGKVQKPRKLSSVGYGMPSKARWKQMKIDVMGDDYTPEELNKMAVGSVRQVNKVVDKISRSLKYKQNGKEYKLPAYYRKKMFYLPDSNGKNRKTAISEMVTKALVKHVQKDFANKLVQMATEVNAGENYEEMLRISRCVCRGEEVSRKQRAQAYFETNIAALRKSIF